MDDLYYVYTLTGLFCGLIASFLLFFLSKGGGQYANRLLATILSGLGVCAFLKLLTGWGEFEGRPWVGNLYAYLYFMLIPWFLLYIKSILTGQLSWKKTDGRVFIPVACAVALDLILPPEWEGVSVRGGIRVCMGAGYLFYQWKLVIRYRIQLRQKEYVGEKEMKRWLVYFSCLTAVICPGLALEIVAGFTMAGKIEAFTFAWLSVYLLSRPNILFGEAYMTVPEIRDCFSEANHPGQTNRKAETGPQKDECCQEPDDGNAQRTVSVQKVFLDESLLQDHMLQIKNYLIEHQYFKKKGLTMPELARELSLPQHHLSYILKYGYKQQFNDFINGYRIEYIKIQMTGTHDWKNKTLEAIGMDAGFSSRSTFFAVFKKQTGTTPSEFARELDRQLIQTT